jgi:hypothetical protein
MLVKLEITNSMTCHIFLEIELGLLFANKGRNHKLGHPFL